MSNGVYEEKFKHMEDTQKECKQERINDREIIHTRIERTQSDFDNKIHGLQENIKEIDNKGEEKRKEMETKIDTKFTKLNNSLKTTNRRNVGVLISVAGFIIVLLIGALAFMYQDWHTQQNNKYDQMIELIMKIQKP